MPAAPPEATPSAPLWPAYRCWRAIAGPLADFVLPAPFLSPQAVRLRRPSHPAARRLAESLRRSALAWERPTVLLEAPPRLGLAAAMLLLPDGWRMAPLYGRWPLAPGERSVLPTEPLAGWLVWLADHVRSPKACPELAEGSEVRSHCHHTDKQSGASAHPGTKGLPETQRAGQGSDAGEPLCVLLDSERNREVSRRVLSRRFDNRYDYAAHMLPPAERLLGLGVQRIHWVGPAALVPEDLESYAAGLIAAGIELDLAALPPVPAIYRRSEPILPAPRLRSGQALSGPEGSRLEPAEGSAVRRLSLSSPPEADHPPSP